MPSGCGPDLVHGIGEVFPVGNVDALAAALSTVARDVPERRARLRDRLAGFTIAQTAAGYEQAAVALARRRRRPPAATSPAAAGERTMS